MKKVYAKQIDGINWHKMECDSTSDSGRNIHKVINRFVLCVLLKHFKF